MCTEVDEDEQEGTEGLMPTHSQRYVHFGCKGVRNMDAPDEKDDGVQWDWGRKRERKRTSKLPDYGSGCDLMDVDWEIDSFLEQVGQEVGGATDVPSQVKHAVILGREGSTVYGATRSNLNVSTLDSAGASSAYCMVQCCLDPPHYLRCFSERCG